MSRTVICYNCLKKVNLDNSDEQKIKNLFDNKAEIYECRFDHFLCINCLKECKKQRIDLDLDCDK